MIIWPIIILALVAFFASVKIVNQQEKGIVVRLGKVNRVITPGLNILIPFVDALVRVDMRERVINVDPQKVITKDNVGVVVDAVIFYKVVDPVKAEFEVEDFDLAATTLAQTNLRNLIGDKTLDETLTARDIVNVSLREVLDEATNSWGVKVTRVEVQKIDPPEEIVDAMSLQMKAEREKRAAVLQAEGVRQSQVLQAQGGKEAAVLDAEGVAQATILKANAEAEAIKQVAESANKYFADKAQKWRQMEVTERVFEQNTTYVIPSGSDLVNVLGIDDANGKKKIVPLKK